MFLISGASGFVGGHLLSSLSADGHAYRPMSRTPMSDGNGAVADLSDQAALAAACAGIKTVFHCAGYAHAFSSLSGDDATLHWQVNFEGTRNLVEAAGQAGVRRFVFLSSVKAMAEPGEVCADEDFPGNPDTAYGESKRAAEIAVLAAGQRYGMHVVNLRLAMVYGAGGRGNLERMGRLVKRGWFPPLPETGNHRSLIHVDDVVSAMRLVAEDDRASGKTYIVAGQEAPSGRALFNALRAAQGLPSCNWTVPVSLLRFAANLGDGLERLLRRRVPLDTEALDRLLGSAWYSPAYIERDLCWRAKVSLHDGLSEMMKK
jgi:nucleoside-diphosphate-sugar epimerase